MVGMKRRLSILLLALFVAIMVSLVCLALEAFGSY